MGRLRSLFSTLTLLSLSGCVTHQLQIVDSITHQPIPGAEVAGYRFREFNSVSNDFSWTALNSDVTGKDGTTTSREARSFVPVQNQFKFVVTKPGYRAAEVLIQPSRTFVASPAQEAGWIENTGDRQHPAGTIPTRNFRESTDPARIVVQMYRDEPEPVAATSASIK